MGWVWAGLVIPDEYRCVCGGTIPVPRQLTAPPAEAIQAMCSDLCGRLWEFSYDETGAFTGLSPQLASAVLGEAS